jgi:hypothetical protein
MLPLAALAQPVGGDIAGTVTDKDSSAPLELVTVTAYDTGGVPSPSVQTDVNGVYDIPALAAGDYTVRFEPPTSEHLAKYYLDVDLAGLATTVTVTDGIVTGNIDQALPDGGAITGTVTAKDTGATMPDVTVTVERTGVVPVVATTDANGVYDFPDLIAGEYTVKFEPFDGLHISKYYKDVDVLTDATIVDVTNGHLTDSIDQALPLGGALSGVVEDSVTHAPMIASHVTLWHITYVGHQMIPEKTAETDTDDNGEYSFSLIHSGAYTVQADTVDVYHIASTFYISADSIGSATLALVMEAVETTDIDVKMIPKGLIAGHVSDTTGGDVPNCGVGFFRYNTRTRAWDPFAETAADDFGNYTSGLLNPGTYRAYFVPSEVDLSHASGAFYRKPDYDHGDSFSVTANNTFTADNILEMTAIITGKVMTNDASMTPIEGLSVTAWQQTGTGTWKNVATATTCGNLGDPNSSAWGMYDLYVPAGTYKLQYTPYRAFWYSQWFSRKTSLQTATAVTVVATQHLIDVNVKLNWAPHQRYAVLPGNQSNYSSLLSSCGYSYETLADSAPGSEFDSYDMTNVNLLKQFDAVLIDCNDDSGDTYKTIRNLYIPDATESPLSQYVRGGGRLFVSDLYGMVLKDDFQLNPGESPAVYPFNYITPPPVQQVAKQSATASIVEAKMRTYLGYSSCTLAYDLQGSAALTSVDPSAVLSMVVPSLVAHNVGHIADAPVCVTLPLGTGKVQYQTFHMSAQPTALAKPLMIYLLTDGVGIPRITSISPSRGTIGTTVTISGSNFGSSKTSTSYVVFKSTAAVTYKKWTNTQIQVVVPKGAATGPVKVTTKGGTSNGVTFTLTTSPVNPSTWYLAEGTSDWGFDTYVTMENPNKSAVTAAITYMTPKGPVPRADIKLPALSQTTINPRNDIGATDFSTKVTCKEGLPIAVDRRMIWAGPGAPSPEGHSSIGVNYTSNTWYLAEGSANWGFECWLLVQNPNGSPADLTVTYMIEDGAPMVVPHTVPANGRASWNMEADIGKKDASVKIVASIPVIAERAMYRNNRREGHESIGTAGPSNTYYLAEGTTGWGFTTYVLIQNPNSQAATVTITYMTTSGPKVQPLITLPANSRKTIRANDVTGMNNQDFSTQVSGSLPIIAERAMYWGAGSSLGEACHDSVGMSAPHTTFYLPDGEAQNGYETWTCVQNPNPVAVNVQILYMSPSGGADNVKTVNDSIPANSRKTYNMGDTVKNSKAAIEVTCTTSGKKIMVERAMYWNNRGAGANTIGGYSD